MAEDLNNIRRSLKLVEGSLNTIKSRWIPKDKLKRGQKNSPELEKWINLLEQRKYELEDMLRNALREMVSSEMEASGLSAPEPSMAKPSEGTKEEKAKTEEEVSKDLEEKEEDVLSERETLARAQRKESKKRREELGLEEDELRVKRLQREEDEAERKRAEEEEESQKRDRWRRTIKVGRGIKKGARVAHGVVTLGEGWTGFFIFFALVIWFLDSFYGYIGPAEFSFALRDIWNLGAWSVFLIIIVAHMIRNWQSFDIGEWVTYGIAVLILLFVAFTGTLNRIGLMHLIFIVALWFVVIRHKEDQVTSNILLSVLIIIDFYRFVILKAFLPMTWVTVIMRVPILLIGTIVYLEGKFPERRLPKIAFWGLVITLLLLNWQSVVLMSKAVIATEEGAAVMGPLEVVRGIVGGIKNMGTDLIKTYEEGMEYATGGYYKGMVEENEDEELGVYLDNVETADTRFYSGEQVVIWGDLQARTLDEPIYIYMRCGTVDSKGNIEIEGDIFPKALVNPDYLKDHKKGYEIRKLEEIGFECRFDHDKSKEFKNGTNRIVVIAEFNFNTLAFLKTYFMDIERIRALRKENVDPLEHYGITDKIPTAVYTNGPIRLGMGTVDPPIGLSDETDVFSHIGVTVESQWNGQIKNITKVEIQLPDVLELIPYSDSSGNLYCRGGFERIGEEEGYVKYAMTKKALEEIKTPITTYKSWRCSIPIPKTKTSQVLGNTPVTTYYYRANVGYIYEFSEDVSVYIEPVPVPEKTKLTDCNQECTNPVGCICDVDECVVGKGESVDFNNNCGGVQGNEA